MNACYWLATWAFIALIVYLVGRPMFAEIRTARAIVREARRR